MKNSVNSIFRWVAWLALRVDRYSDRLRNKVVPGLVAAALFVLMMLSWERSKLIPALLLGILVIVTVSAYILRKEAPQAVDEGRFDNGLLYQGLGWQKISTRAAYRRYREEKYFPAPDVDGSNYKDSVPDMPVDRPRPRRDWLNPPANRRKA